MEAFLKDSELPKLGDISKNLKLKLSKVIEKALLSLKSGGYIRVGGGGKSPNAPYLGQKGGNLPEEFFNPEAKGNYFAAESYAATADASPTIGRAGMPIKLSGGGKDKKQKKYKFVTVAQLKKVHPNANKELTEEVNSIILEKLKFSIKAY